MRDHPRRRRRRREPLAASDVLRRFRRTTSGSPAPTAAGAAGAAATAWPSVVGPAAAEHSTPVRRSRAGVLTVACSSAAWAHELSARREELAARLAEACPGAEVSSLRFSVSDQVFSAAAPEAPPPVAPAPPGPDDRARGAAAAQGVTDPRLRELIERAAAASEARRRAGDSE